MNEILVCITNSGCYDSMDFFAEQAVLALRNAGKAVRIFDWKKEGELGLVALFGKHYKAILDFNSKLPKMKYRDSSLLNYLNGPIFDWMLDHPLYHHDYLKNIEESHDFHVICLDENHTDYIRKYYPAIKSVQTLPLAGTKVKQEIAWEQKKKDIVCCATYCNSKKIMDSMKDGPPELMESSLWMADYLLHDVKKTVEQAGNAFRENNPRNMLTALPFPMFLQLHFMVDTYIKAYFREKILDILLEENIPIVLYGANWKEYSQKNSRAENKIQGEISYEKSLEIQAEHDIVLNVMPWFKAGIHDRVLTAMSGGSVCLTDSTPYLEHLFQKEKMYVSFEIDHLEKLPDKVLFLLEHKNYMEQIAKAGRSETEHNHMWSNRMKELF